ncbi:MAG TPA: 2-oxoacid:acceptor oxidoreductase family protein [Dehalococcoidia bacterium]|nr:2-oxoacid:acceptor oxidoreductase family protein [Dehalococcoidia bacterium]
MRREIRFAGFGGQGIILAGLVTGRAAALHDGREAIVTQSYGPEARGGACSAQVVLDDAPIDYPMVTRPDVLVVMSQEAAQRYTADLADDCAVLIDRDLVELRPQPGWKLYAIPATALAERLGNRMAANVVMLGFFTAVTNLVSREAMEAAVRESVRERFIELNLRAFDAGYRYYREEAAS